MTQNSSEERPEVFVGSSREGLPVARCIQTHLSDIALVSLWNAGVFGLGEGTLEGLVRAVDRFDFAALVLTPDDLTVARDTMASSPRDNVMFELGLFIGRLGRNRAFAVCSDEPNLRLPSDLAGVVVARFNQGDARKDLLAALGPACFLLRTSIEKQGEFRRRNSAPSAPEGGVATALFFLKAGACIEIRFRCGSDWGCDQESESTYESTWRHIFEAIAPERDGNSCPSVES